MAEYIEREAVLKICRIADYAYNIADEVEKLPSADVKPVVHGEWIVPNADPIDMMFMNPRCSECGFESADHLNFCPNCGARMDEE